MVTILEKTEHNTDFHQIVDFLEASHIRHLKLNNEEGISSLPDTELFENLSLMGYNILPNQRDDRQGEAFPTVSSLDVGQDRENIAKTSALPHDSSPRVTSLNADEGRCSNHRGDNGIREELGVDKSTNLGSNDTEEMVNVLNSMEAMNILTSGGAAASVSPGDVLPTAGVPTVSGSFPTASVIFTIASVVTPYTIRPRRITIRSSQPMRCPIVGAKDKGKEKVVVFEVPKKRKLQE
nr:hypothetical protein [Tanacetum cinerariifolium]